MNTETQQDTAPAQRGDEPRCLDRLVGWLRGKRAEAEKNMTARAQMATTNRSGTDEQWDKVADMHPSTRGRRWPKAERLKDADRQDRIAAQYRRDMQMYQEAIDRLTSPNAEVEARREKASESTTD